MDIAPAVVSRTPPDRTLTPILLVPPPLPAVPVREIFPAPALTVLLLISIPGVEAAKPLPSAVAVKLPPLVAIVAPVMLIPAFASSTTFSLPSSDLISTPLLILILRSASRRRVASPPAVLLIASLTVISPFPPEPPAVVTVTSVPASRDASIVAGVTFALAPVASKTLGLPPEAVAVVLPLEIVISLGSSSQSPP